MICPGQEILCTIFFSFLIETIFKINHPPIENNLNGWLSAEQANRNNTCFNPYNLHWGILFTDETLDVWSIEHKWNHRTLGEEVWYECRSY